MYVGNIARRVQAGALGPGSGISGAVKKRGCQLTVGMENCLPSPLL